MKWTRTRFHWFYRVLITVSLTQLTTVEAHLAKTMLVRETEQSPFFCVNFSPRLMIMFQEVQCAFQCGIRVPNIAAFIYSRKGILLRIRDEAQVSVRPT